jgi:hypothetical protein
LSDFGIGDVDNPKSILKQNALATCCGLELEQHPASEKTRNDIVYPCLVRENPDAPEQ